MRPGANRLSSSVRAVHVLIPPNRVEVPQLFLPGRQPGTACVEFIENIGILQAESLKGLSRVPLVDRHVSAPAVVLRQQVGRTHVPNSPASE